MRPSDLLDEGARQRLANAVRQAERRTQGEIVVAVVGACDEYGSAGWRLGVVLAVLAYCALHVFAPPLAWWAYLAAEVAALAAGHALARLAPIRRALLPPELVERRVRERAHRSFLENGLARTQGRTGILLFVSLLERHVVVLGDSGIHRALDPDERWQEVVDLAVEGLRSGRGVDGVEAAVRRCGQILTRHFPVSADRNLDELPNAVVIEE